MSQPRALNGSSRPRVCLGERVFHVLSREDPGEQLMQPCSRMYYAVLRGTSAAYVQYIGPGRQLGNLAEAMRKHNGKLAEALPDTRHRPGSVPRRAAALGKRSGITPEAFPDAWKRRGSARESPWKPQGSAPKISEAPPRRGENVWVSRGSERPHLPLL